MIVYASNKAGFSDDVVHNRIADRVEDAVFTRLGRRTPKNEFQSWANSLQRMHNAIQDPEIPDDTGVAIEYRIPGSAKRIDFLLTGQNQDGDDTVVIVELKQWTDVKTTALPDMVSTYVGGGVRETPHPSYQAWSYAALLSDFNEEVYDNRIRLNPCAYLHNCDSASVLRDGRYSDLITRAPVFLKQESAQLTDFIKKHVRKGDKDALLYRIEKGRIRPSKQLADHLASLLEGNQDFVLIDDQKVVYETALARVKTAQPDGRKKQVIVIEGGPGTGKSVVAVNLLVDLVSSSELNAAYVSQNAAPRAVYKERLTGLRTKKRIDSLFQGSGGFMETDSNTFDALITDEAHRLSEKSGFYKNQGDNQIKEIIQSSRASVFFVDDLQRVTLRDIGRRSEIERLAELEGAEVTTLKLSSQFRCNGSDGYLAWLDQTLQIADTAHESLESVDFDFQVCDSPNDLRDRIRQKNLGRNKSRMVAGYCWPWLSKKDPGAMDVVIPEFDFEMQWNLSEDGSLWIVKETSVEQIGCIHTCQGLELDYVGVILGPDLIVRDGVIQTDGTERASQDSSIRGLKKMLKEDPEKALSQADQIIKNTYRTLMSRGLKGCYIFSVDQETNEWLRSAMIGNFATRETSADVATKSSDEIPLRLLDFEEASSSENAAPLYDLAAAAGVFGADKVAESPEWVELPNGFQSSPDLFVARVVGDSMNRRVPNGSLCLFKANPSETNQNKIVLVQHADIADPELGGRFTLKVYGSEMISSRDGGRSKRIVLSPDSTDPSFKPIVLDGASEAGCQILAELVAVIC